jgi:hypothetical protein
MWPTALRNAWSIAETLLHEAAHKKLSDILLTWPIMRAGFSNVASRTIPAVWNRSHPAFPNTWSIDRVLLGFHVYVHLGLFQLVASDRLEELAPRFGAAGGDVSRARMRRAFDKARYLGERLMPDGLGELADDGRHLAEWLWRILAQVDGDAHARDPLPYLLWARLDRETDEIAAALEQRGAWPSDDAEREEGSAPDHLSARRTAERLVQQQLAAACHLLPILAGDVSSWAVGTRVRSASCAPSGMEATQLAATFRAIRELMSSTLRAASGNGLSRLQSLDGTNPVADLLTDLTERAAPQIQHLVTELAGARAPRSNEDRHDA